MKGDFIDLKEIAMIASVMSHEMFDDILAAVQEGVMMAHDYISGWSNEFYEKYGELDWEEVHDNPEEYGLTGTDWEDYIVNFTHDKIKELSNEERIASFGKPARATYCGEPLRCNGLKV